MQMLMRRPQIQMAVLGGPAGYILAGHQVARDVKRIRTGAIFGPARLGHAPRRFEYDCLKAVLLSLRRLMRRAVQLPERLRDGEVTAANFLEQTGLTLLDPGRSFHIGSVGSELFSCLGGGLPLIRRVGRDLPTLLSPAFPHALLRLSLKQRQCSLCSRGSLTRCELATFEILGNDPLDRSGTAGNVLKRDRLSRDL